MTQSVYPPAPERPVSVGEDASGAGSEQAVSICRSTSELEGCPAGLVLFPRKADDGAELLAVAEAVAARPEYTMAVLDSASGEARLLTLGPSSAVKQLLTAEDGPSDGGDGKTLSELRHQLNNHLTAALAEAQMVLLDLEPGEIRGHCERIHDQLRAIARAVAATRPQG